MKSKKESLEQANTIKSLNSKITELNEAIQSLKESYENSQSVIQQMALENEKKIIELRSQNEKVLLEQQV